jgi:hypothetical protein
MPHGDPWRPQFRRRPGKPSAKTGEARPQRRHLARRRRISPACPLAVIRRRNSATWKVRTKPGMVHSG